MKKFIAIAVILMCCLVYAIVKLSMSENQNMSQNQQAYKQAEEGPDSAVPAVQVEAVTKVFGEFQSAIKNEDYEQAWKLMSEVVKSGLSFEEFTKGVNVLANAIIHPESATNIEGRVRLLITSPEDELYLSFIQEDGQWKLYNVRPAQNVDTSKE